jgi:hypothetical protein
MYQKGPFVHISTCVGFLVASVFPKYRDNGRKMREMLSAACAAGLSVAFGAPIGGVLFSYEEISTYFPRKVLWRAFLCSAVAAMVLKELNPTGTGKLVLFETNYGTSYSAVHYLVFVVLGKYRPGPRDILTAANEPLNRHRGRHLRWSLLQIELPLEQNLPQIRHHQEPSSLRGLFDRPRHSTPTIP